MRLGLGLNITANSRRGGTPAFSPSTLYSSGSQGVWYDPSDLSTMFSDRAGTTPVTTPGTVVGLRLDKSKGLALGAELVANGDFASGTGWSLTSSYVISGGEMVISGTVSGYATQNIGLVAGRTYKVTFQIVSRVSGGVNFLLGDSGSFSSTFNSVGTHSFYARAAGNALLYINGSPGGSANFSIDNISVRELPGNHATAPTDAARPIYGVEPKGGRRNLLLATDTLATQSLTVTAAAHTLAFTGTGTVTLTGASTAGPLVGTGAGNRVSLTFTPTAASLTLTVSGSVTLGQLELGSSVTAYQRVTTAYDVTESGVPTCHYVQYDGSDDSMSTAAIDFTATDKMSVFAGVRFNAYTANGMVYGLSTDFTSTAGTFGLRANTASAVQILLNGTVLSNVQPTVPTMPSSVVFTHLMDIGAATGAENGLRVNGGAATYAGNNAGTGNFSNQPLFIGRFAGTSSPLNGKDYGIIIVGKAASAGEITDTETWLAAKTSGVTI